MRLLPLLCLTASASCLTTACKNREDTAQAQSDAAASAPAPAAPARVYHVVSFRFKPDALTYQAVHKQATNPDGSPTIDHTGAPVGVIDSFADLQNTVFAPDDASRKLIQSFTYGMNNSTEQASFGPDGTHQDRTLEYTFTATFLNCTDRNYYVDKAPTHQLFKKLVAQYLNTDVSSGVFVIDYLDGATLPKSDEKAQRTDDCADVN